MKHDVKQKKMMLNIEYTAMIKNNHQEQYLNHKLNILVLKHLNDERFKPVLREIVLEKIEQFKKEKNTKELIIHQELLQHLLK